MLRARPGQIEGQRLKKKSNTNNFPFKVIKRNLFAHLVGKMNIFNLVPDSIGTDFTRLFAV